MSTPTCFAVSVLDNPVRAPYIRSFNLHDLKGSLALDMGVTGAPETFLIKDGVVLVHYSGEVNQAIWDSVFIPIIQENKMFK